jgi:hypothetical protein
LTDLTDKIHWVFKIRENDEKNSYIFRGNAVTADDRDGVPGRGDDGLGNVEGRIRSICSGGA